MAEIHVEKKSGGLAWLWILLAILLIAILVWLFWPDAQNDPLTEAVPGTTAGDTIALPPPPTIEPIETPAESTIGAIRANPQQWVGREFSGAVTVAEVPTDRGFWVEQDGQRLFAIVHEPTEERIDINPGQRLMILGTVRDASYLSQIQGEPLSEETSGIVRGQPAFLVTEASSIAIVEGP